MKKLRLKNPSYRKLLEAFKAWLDVLGYAPTTVYYLPNHLREFFHYLEGIGCQKLEEITAQTLKTYYQYLQERSNQRREGGLSKSYLNKHQQALKKFRDFLRKHGNSTAFKVHLQSESQPVEERQNILTQEEVKQLFEATDLGYAKEHYRLRDRALLVVLYSCGLRRNEAVHLDVSDVLFDKGQLYVRKGKNYRERLVPFNRKNGELLEDYLYEGRGAFTNIRWPTEAFFVSLRGGRMGGRSFVLRLQKLVQATENAHILEKGISPHSLRHSIATHLLQEEVPMQQIKTFLGHRSLESTQLYVHLLKTLEDECLPKLS